MSQQHIAAQMAGFRSQLNRAATLIDVTVDTVDPLVVSTADGDIIEGAIPLGVTPRANLRALVMIGDGRAWLMPQVQPGDPAPGEIDELLAGRLDSMELLSQIISERVSAAREAALAAGVRVDEAQAVADEHAAELEAAKGQLVDLNDQIFGEDGVAQQAQNAWNAAVGAMTGLVVEYATTTSPTDPPTGGWSTGTPSHTEGSYTWMRTLVTHGDGTSSYTAPVRLTGDQGSTGSGTTTYTWVRYADSATGAGISANPAGKAYIGFAYNKLVSQPSNNAADYAWSLIRGEPGGDGISVVSVTPYYRRQSAGAAAPAPPTGTTPPSTWSATEPGYEPDTELWRVERVLFSNGQVSYTEVTLVASYQAAAVAIQTANSKNTIYKVHAATLPPPTPTHQGSAVGDVTWAYSDPDLRGVVVGQWTWSGSHWDASTIGSEIVDSLAVDKLVVTGGARMPVAVIDDLMTQNAFMTNLLAQKIVVAGNATNKVSAVMIADGAVTASKIHAAAIDGKTITGVKVQAGELVSGTITGGTISGTTITGVTITGGTVTGSTVRTASSGARAQLDTYGGGRLLFTGPGGAQTARFGNQTSGEPSIYMYNYSSTGTTGALRVTLNASSGLTLRDPDGRIQGSVLGSSSRGLVISSNAGGVDITSSSVVYIGGPSPASGHTIQMAVTSNINMEASQITLRSTAAGPDSNDAWRVRSATAGGRSASTLQYVLGSSYMLHTTAPANLHLSTSGYVLYVTSARKAKTDIRTVEHPERILDVPIRHWVDAAQLDEDPSYSTRTPGVVAEEVESAGLGDWVTRHGDGEIAGVMYDRLPLLLIPLVRELRDRVTALEESHG